MSERVQLLLSDRILGMTLVPEGKVWNYGIGLTQLWSNNLSYSVTLDNPLLFWAEEHRPANFLTVSLCITMLNVEVLTILTLTSSQILRLVTTAPTWKTASHNLLTISLSLLHYLYCSPILYMLLTLLSSPS
jgi:hypothetical protein